jgi:hypothetical protein
MPGSSDDALKNDVTVVVIDSNELRRDWRAKITRPIVGWGLAGLGALFIVIGYFGVANQALVAKQLPYLVSGGIGGMVLVAVGAFLLGTDDVRKQLQRVERLESLVDDLHRTLLVPAGGAQTEVTPDLGSATRPNGAVLDTHVELVALPRGKSYHLLGCSMVAGKEAPPIEPAEISARELQPCPLCTPAPVHVV